MKIPANLLTLRQAADVAGLSPVTLRVQIANGRLLAQTIGRDRYVWRKDLDAYLASRWKRKAVKR
jgi:excisionase family DNA binding protein